MLTVNWIKHQTIRIFFAFIFYHSFFLFVFFLTTSLRYDWDMKSYTYLIYRSDETGGKCTCHKYIYCLSILHDITYMKNLKLSFFILTQLPYFSFGGIFLVVDKNHFYWEWSQNYLAISIHPNCSLQNIEV